MTTDVSYPYFCIVIETPGSQEVATRYCKPVH